MAGAPVGLSDLRTQAERELRGKLLQLQTGLLMNASDGTALGDLLKRALPSFVTYLRAVLRLSGRKVPARTPEVIREGMSVVDGPPDAFIQVWDARVGKQKLKLTLRDRLVEQYHTVAEQTAEMQMTHQRLLAALDAASGLSSDDLQRVSDTIAEDTWEHYAVHTAEIERWLADHSE